MKIIIDPNKSIEENASIYYDKAKKLKKKLEGAKLALEKAKEKKERLLRQAKTAEAEHEEEAAPARKKEWFEKFRWFVSSEGFLVVGGRDATTNEIIIKKHAEKGDIVLHTDMAGSPFFVIKTEGKEPGEATLRQAADATVTFSRAWKLGHSSADVFYVAPDQVTKEANTGEFLPKGAFMIRGKTNYMDNRTNLAVGVYEDKVMAAPVEAISAHCPDYMVLEQGDGKASDAAKQIKKRLGGDLDEIIRALPSGGMRISDSNAPRRKP